MRITEEERQFVRQLVGMSININQLTKNSYKEGMLKTMLYFEAYIVNKQGAEVLECEGVRGHNYKLMADDFIMQQQLRREKEKDCFHCSLSFYPGEVLSNELTVQISKEYLEKLRITNTQFAITKHTDRKHIHLHVVANMVNNNGKAISDSYIGYKGKKIAQQLTLQYKLIPALSKKILTSQIMKHSIIVSQIDLMFRLNPSFLRVLH